MRRKQKEKKNQKNQKNTNDKINNWYLFNKISNHFYHLPTSTSTSRFGYKNSLSHTLG